MLETLQILLEAELSKPFAESDPLPQPQSWVDEAREEGLTLCRITFSDPMRSAPDLRSEMKEEVERACILFGAEDPSEVPEERFYSRLRSVRRFVGDRAMLRTIHCYEEHRRISKQLAALRENDLPEFLCPVREGAHSDWMLAQTTIPAGEVEQQPIAFAQILAERVLGTEGAVRREPTQPAALLALVPLALEQELRQTLETAMGESMSVETITSSSVNL